MNTFLFYYFDNDIKLIIGVKTCKEPRRTSYWKELSRMKETGKTDVIGFNPIKNVA